jgi:hypothetical protein
MKIFIIGGVSVLESEVGFPQNRELLGRTMKALGRDLVKRGHDLVLCSPFENSADRDAASGAADAASERKVQSQNSTIRPHRRSLTRSLV